MCSPKVLGVVVEDLAMLLTSHKEDKIQEECKTLEFVVYFLGRTAIPKWTAQKRWDMTYEWMPRTVLISYLTANADGTFTSQSVFKQTADTPTSLPLTSHTTSDNSDSQRKKKHHLGDHAQAPFLAFRKRRLRVSMLAQGQRHPNSGNMFPIIVFL